MIRVNLSSVVFDVNWLLVIIKSYVKVNFKERNNNLTLKAPTPQNGQTHLNNSSKTLDKLFECVSAFCGIGS